MLIISVFIAICNMILILIIYFSFLFKSYEIKHYFFK